jgi:hypothetical protein
MEDILQFILNADVLFFLFSTLLTIGVGYFVGKGFSFKEIQDIIDVAKESYEDGYIDPDEARLIYKEIEDVIGKDWFIRLIKLVKR